LTVLQNKNIKLILNYVAGPALLAILFYAVSHQLKQQPGWKSSLIQIKAAFTGNGQWKLYAMFALMWVNWGLEAAKWKISILPVQRISFIRAFQAILAGSCIASFTPNRMGEYFGRMLYLDKGKKIQSVSPAIVCSMAQILVTLIAGLTGLLLFRRFIPPHPAGWLTSPSISLFILVTGISALLLATIYFRFDPLVGLINRLLKKYVKTISLPEHFGNPVLFKILLFSFVRYGVFLLQYLLLFSLFELGISGTDVFMGVSVMFVVMAVIPSFTLLTDLGLRWEAGIQIFRVFTLNTAGILAVSLGIWLINLIIPALIGSLLILRIKLFGSR
jgi:hypothetical protein